MLVHLNGRADRAIPEIFERPTVWVSGDDAVEGRARGQRRVNLLFIRGPLAVVFVALSDEAGGGRQAGPPLPPRSPSRLP